MSTVTNEATSRNFYFVDGRQIKFDNPLEEIAYLRTKLEVNQIEFQEFQDSSRELEIEYETQVKQLEKKNDESQYKLNRLELENEQLKSRYNAYTGDTQHRLNEYQQQIAELTALNDRLTSYIRELEQSNDDLERARRTLAASLEDFEGQLNQQIERNVLLENEISEKEELECVIQRLKEEARDLRHELIVKTNSNSESAKRKQLLMESYLSNAQRDCSLQSFSSTRFESAIANTTNQIGGLHLNSSKEESPTCDKNPNVDSLEAGLQNGSSETIPSTTATPATTTTSTPKRVDSTTSPMTPKHGAMFSFSSPASTNESNSCSKSTETKSQQTSTPSSPKLPPSVVLTPSTRLSALNIVSDLLRKVGALESKLSTTAK